MSYADLAEFKRYVRVPDLDDVDDTELQGALDTATSAIAHLCSRDFEIVGDTPTTRYFQPWYDGKLGRWVLPTDDVFDTTGYTVHTWDTTDVAWTVPVVFAGSPWRPLNTTGTRPYTQLILPPGASIGRVSLGEALSMYAGWQSDENADYLAVTALWGWPAVPAAIKSATLLQASRFFKRRDSPFGLTSSPDGSENSRLLNSLDVDVQVACRPYVKYWAAR